MIVGSLSGATSSSKITDGDIHSVQPRPGDALSTILARYGFTKSNGLKQEFLELNGLNALSNLYLHKRYKLPIYLYNYDKKSIRTTIGINDWKKAVRIKEYNEMLLKKGARRTHFTKSNILWVPFTEMKEVIPSEATKELAINKGTTKKTTITETVAVKSSSKSFSDKIYGSKHSKVDLIDQSLKGKVFYIISGHGGPDPGAVCEDCSSRLCEDEYAYDVSLRLDKKLRQHGATVELVIKDNNDGIRDDQILKCDSDERLADNSKIPASQMPRLVQRTSYINKKYKEYSRQGVKEQVVVSLHIDSNTKSTKQDVFFCYAKGSKASRKLAVQIRDKFQEKYNYYQKNRGYKGYLHERKFFVLRNTKPPAVLIELANIQNKHNHKRILLKENRQALANWIYEGLAQPKSPVSTKAIASSN